MRHNKFVYTETQREVGASQRRGATKRSVICEEEVTRGLSAGASFYFKPGKGEHIETTVNLEHEKEAAILGTVRDSTGIAAVCDALVLLFHADGDKRLLDRQFTDEEGRFYFGPIEGDMLYQIKIYKNHVKLRELEIVAE